MTKYVIVQKRWKKILAIILFTCALVGNFLVITVGLNLNFVKKVYQRVTKMGYQKAVHIEDIVYLNPINDISMDTNYLINIYPTNATSTEGKLVFTSMTPEVFTLTKNKYTSYVRSAVFDDEEVHKGILRVTSENDKSFVKDLELCFRKKYDDTFKPIPNRVGIKEDDGSYRVYLDTLFVFSIRMKAGTTEKEFSMDYDESFFDHPTEYAFIPKQEGKTQITIHYYDRKTWTFNLHVLPVPKKDVNGINLYSYPSSTSPLKSDTLTIGSSYYLMPAQDGSRRFIPHTITSSDPAGLYISENNVIYPKKSGTYTLTVSTEDTTVTKEVVCESEYIITLPKIKSKYQDPNDKNKINVYNNITCKPSLVYTTSRASHDVELVYDHSFMTASYTGTGSSAYLTISAKQKGESPITLIYGAGTDEQKEITFIINTEQESVSSNVRKVLKYYYKGFSHVALFFILGMATMILSIYAFKKFAFAFKISFVLGFGLVWGALEEFIQKFIPGRNPSWKDIFFYDWFSYLIGIAFFVGCLFIYLVLRNAIQKRKQKKNNALNDNKIEVIEETENSQI